MILNKNLFKITFIIVVFSWLLFWFSPNFSTLIKLEINKEFIIKKASEKIMEVLGNDAAGHDWWHIYRVVKIANKINENENGDPFIVELAAWLHDIADHKYHGGDLFVGPKVARRWMESQNLNEEIISKVEIIIKEISYKGSEVKTPMSSLEGKIVQDADRLDAIGAIGIARTFAYGGSRNRLMYDPNAKPELHHDFESYRSSTAPTINHFYEKLLLLKERMNTETGKRIAIERHRYMEAYLQQFFSEWEGER